MYLLSAPSYPRATAPKPPQPSTHPPPNPHLLEPKTSDSLVLLAPLCEAPLSHDEGVVNRQAVNVVDAHGLHVLILLLIAWEVGGRASWGKRSREGEENNSLALEEVVTGKVLPVKRILIRGLDASTGLEGNTWDGSTFRDSSGRGHGRGHAKS